MNRIIGLILFFSLIHTLHAQKELDQAFLKCQYRYVQSWDTIDFKRSTEDLIILRIGSNISKSCSYYTEEFDTKLENTHSALKYRQSMNTAVTNAAITGKLDVQGLGIRKSTEYIYKNYPQGKMTVTDRIISDVFIYEDELNTQNWQLEDSTKTVMNYNCIKASCHFRGREWVAWFAPDIPISNGPWKLGGLPGLIMEAYDYRHENHFLITGLEKVDDEPILFTRGFSIRSVLIPFQKVERKNFLKTNIGYHRDPVGYLYKQITPHPSDKSARPKEKHIIRYDLLETDYND